jgi:hypothetical protein
MLNLQVYDNDQKIWQQISKAAAKKTFEAGEPIVMCAANMHPFGVWNCGVTIQKNPQHSEDDNDFTKILNSFSFHNCTNETGLYVRYYKKL